MKIYINNKYEIKFIHQTDDVSLLEVDVDRECVFGNMSDFMILNYCYKEDETGYSIYPSRNYSDIIEEDYRNKVDEQQNKIYILEGSQDKQDDKILQTMLATTEIFEMVLMMSTPQTKGADINNYNIGGNSMVEVYVTLILEGVKTIDQVPSVLRAKVQKQLDLLTK